MLGPIAFALPLVLGVAALLERHRLIAEDYTYLILVALIGYLAWRSYNRLTVLLI